MQTAARVALLIDGDNISPAHAETLISVAKLQGDLVFARAYVNGHAKRDGWVNSDSVDSLITGAGGNVSDFRLSFEAVEMEVRGGHEVFIIASNDTDLVHVARWLREKGRTVIVAGTDTMGKALRTCGASVFILPKIDGATVEAKPLPPVVRTADPEQAKVFIRELILENGGTMPMTAFGVLMNKFYGITAKTLGCKTWTRFFKKVESEFSVTGPDSALILSLRESVHAEG